LAPPLRALYDHVEKVTLRPAACTRADVEALRAAGASDLEIHATVQVAAYFNYINRGADALGVDLEPEMREAAEPDDE
jgi:alkylhydroperoxidase family enzyme